MKSPPAQAILCRRSGGKAATCWSARYANVIERGGVNAFGVHKNGCFAHDPDASRQATPRQTAGSRELISGAGHGRYPRRGNPPSFSSGPSGPTSSNPPDGRLGDRRLDPLGGPLTAPASEGLRGPGAVGRVGRGHCTGIEAAGTGPDSPKRRVAPGDLALRGNRPGPARQRRGRLRARQQLTSTRSPALKLGSFPTVGAGADTNARRDARGAVAPCCTGSTLHQWRLISVPHPLVVGVCGPEVRLIAIPR
jgi:hypothetical protein